MSLRSNSLSHRNDYNVDGNLKATSAFVQVSDIFWRRQRQP